MVMIWTTDNGKGLETMDFHTRRNLTKIQSQWRKNKHISCRMLGQLLTSIDLFILANYPVSYKVVKMLQACVRNIFGTCLKRMIIDRMRKTRKHCVVLAYVSRLDWEIFAWMKKFFFTWKEASSGSAR